MSKVLRLSSKKIYAHNLSGFDGIFLLKIIAIVSNKLGLEISIAKRESSLISIKIASSKKNGRTIEFRDSLLLLPASLSKLAKSFNVENKGIFPYSFSNIAPLDYSGDVPTFDYFDKISLTDYVEYFTGYSVRKGRSWSLRRETIKY